MQYKIPRYIDYEARIFGPANFRQFLFLLAGLIAVGFIWLVTESLFVFFLLTLIVGGISIGLGFGKINGRPITTMIRRFIIFKVSGKKTYFWKKKELSPKMIKVKDVEEEKKGGKQIAVSQKKGRLEQVSEKIETS